MTTPDAPPRSPAPVPAVLCLAPHVTLTRLPYGGAVLLNTVTLLLAECGEPQAAALDSLLAAGLPPDRDSPPARLAAELLATGWLTTRPPGPSPAARHEG
ncbi:actinodefensin-associated protein B [Streptomyces chryseus]